MADMQQLRDYLLDPKIAMDFADAFADMATSELAETEGNADVVKLHGFIVKELAAKNMGIVQKHAESAIEKMFLGSLVLGFLKSAPLRARFLPPADDCNAAMAGFFDYHDKRKAAYKAYTAATGDESLQGFMADLRRGGCAEDEIDRMTRDFVVFDAMFEDAFHFIPQAKFPDVKVNGRGIRVDLFAFLPCRRKVKIAIECDGFEYHSDRKKFTSDRVRDRALRSAGIDSLRFSGSEIFADPMQASADAMEQLFRDYPTR